MSEQTHYVIVESRFRHELEGLVNARIKAGFVPLGGVGCTSDRDRMTNENRMFFQAMIYTEIPPTP